MPPRLHCRGQACTKGNSLRLREKGVGRQAKAIDFSQADHHTINVYLQSGFFE
jgi:hypothetical protein